jgi:hypothetical protein
MLQQRALADLPSAGEQDNLKRLGKPPQTIFEMPVQGICASLQSSRPRQACVAFAQSFAAKRLWSAQARLRFYRLAFNQKKRRQAAALQKVALRRIK